MRKTTLPTFARALARTLALARARARARVLALALALAPLLFLAAPAFAPRIAAAPAAPTASTFTTSAAPAAPATSAALTALTAPAASTPAAPASEISRTPPPLYTEKIAPLLTPLDDAIKLIPEVRANAKDASGIVLLDERLNWIDAQGRRAMVWHTAYKCLVEAGVEGIASDTFTYRKHDQKFTLVLAETIQPDGAVLPVKAGAVILQTPQRQADNALYDDLAEVRVIYPNVKPGSITHSIVLIEDLVSRMPGEYSQNISWGYGWPVAISHCAVDLPAPLAQRVRLFPLGPDVPARTTEKISGENKTETATKNKAEVATKNKTATENKVGAETETKTETKTETEPEPKTETAVAPEPETGRIRHTWRGTLLPALKYEPNRAPAPQTGPSVTLTSIASWDGIARWYSALARDRATPAPALAAKIDEWTRGLDPAKPDDRDAIIRILFAKVANDVRYTGLEFGDSDYQPHDCNEVWENQYGDCKDKANLLCALLRRKNIPAHIALINTEHLGLIDRRAPNFRVFNHAIVAIPAARDTITDDDANNASTNNAPANNTTAAPATAYLFCDPTITWAEPGTLHNGDTDRDALVVNETAATADWARTPPQKGARVAYNFALRLAPAGEISGWLTITAEGHPASAWRAWSRGSDTDGLRAGFQQQVRAFYDGAGVIDIAAEPAATTSGPCVAKAYFIVPGQQTSVSTLAFPIDNNLLPATGDSAQRETPFPLAQGRTIITAAIKLPPGAAPSRQIAPYRVSTPSLTAAASWSYAPLTQTCHARLDIDITQPSVSAAEFARLYQALQSLRAWLQQPLLLSTTTAKTTALAAATSTTAAASPASGAAAPPPPSALQPFSPSALSLDFPMMPTAAGQLDLADARYPIDDNHDRALARAAQEKIIQYFPGDKPTVFAATVNLALIDWYAGKNQEALDRLAPLLPAGKNDVTPERYAWGEYMQALILHDLKRDTEALAICNRLALDTRLTPYRRSNAALQVYNFAGQSDPAATLPALDAVATLRSDNETAILAAIARLTLRQDTNDAPLRARLETLLQTRPADAQTMLATVITQSKTWTGPNATASQTRLADITAALVPAPSAELAAALKDTRARLAATSLALETQNLLKKSLAEPPCSDHYKPAPEDDALKTPDDYDRAIKTAADRNDASRASMLYLSELATLPAGENFSNLLVQAVLYLEWKDRLAGSPAAGDPLFDLVCKLCERYPRDSDPYNESRLQLASYLRRREKHDEVQAIYENLARSPDTPAPYLPAAYSGLARSLERKGDFPAALDACKNLEPRAADSPRAADALLRAIFINLHEDRPAEALRIIKILETCPDPILKKTEAETNIREFIALARSGEAEKFWAARSKWWPQWLAFEKKYAPQPAPAAAAPQAVPVIPDADDLITKIANTGGDARKKNTWSALQTLASAARWLPSAGANFTRTIAGLREVSPLATGDFYRLAIAILDIPVSEKNHLRERLFQLSFALAQDKRYDASFAAIARFKAIKSDPADWRAYNIDFVWMQAALESKKQLREVAAALAADLANPDSAKGNSRDNFVLNLANVYRALGDTEAESALLQREMENPWFAANKDALDSLKQRAAQLDAGKNFAAQVAAWLRDNPLPWYDYAEPSTLADPRLRKLDEALQNPPATFTYPEIIKLNLLAAQSLDGTQERQRKAMLDAIVKLGILNNTLTKRRNLSDSIIDREDFDRDTRDRLLASSLWTWFYLDKKDDFARAVERLRARPLTPDQEKRITVYSLAMQADRSSADSIASTMRQLSEDEIDYIGVSALQQLFVALLDLGALDTARAIAEESRQWRYAADVTQTPTAIAFDYTRRLDAVASLEPIHDTLIRIVDERIKDAPGAPPANFDDLCIRGIPDDASYAEQRAFCLWSIKQRKFDRSSLRIWGLLLRSFVTSPEDEKVSLEMVAAAIQNAPDDQTRATAIKMALSSIDTDKAWIRDALAAAMAPYRDPAGNPATYDIIRIVETETDLRTGGDTDPQVLMADTKSPAASLYRMEMSLKYNLQRKDKTALKQLVTKGSSSQLLARSFLPLVIPAFDLLEMKTEAGMARDIARREARQGILDAWAGDTYSLTTTLRLVKTLDDPTLMPPAFLASLDALIRDPLMRMQVRLTQARVEKNWPAVLENAVNIIAYHPTFYSYYWDKAEALWNLGRKAEAKPALEIYTRYCKNDLEYPEARRMLGEL